MGCGVGALVEEVEGMEGRRGGGMGGGVGVGVGKEVDLGFRRRRDGDV